MEEKKKARKCYECSGTMEGTRENYRYTECGLSSVTLVDVLVYHCKCGAIVPEIPASGMLHEAIAIEVLRKKSLLSGEEIRFLRKMTGYTATKLASIMAVTKETVSRWENGKSDIGKESDRLLRFVCLDGIVRNTVPPDIESEKFVEGIRKLRTLNLPDVFERLEALMKGSKSINVNPALLSQFGLSGLDDFSGPSSTVLQ